MSTRRVADLSRRQIARSLRGDGLRLRTGRFVTTVRSPIPAIADGLALLYRDSALPREPFADFHVTLHPGRGLRRWLRRQAHFALEGARPFTPLPFQHAFPLLEWGMNWCVTNHCHDHLVIHAAVVEKRGRALILPGDPGAGKSTLCAALVARGGWRLLSDELTLIDPDTLQIVANPRPVSLKNASIDVIRAFAPEARLSDPVHDTVKGSVAHMRPPADSVRRVDQPAAPALVLFPRFDPVATGEPEPVSRGETFIRLADNAFNYSILGVTGFRTIAGLLDRCDCYRLRYPGDLAAALRRIDELIDAR